MLVAFSSGRFPKLEQDAYLPVYRLRENKTETQMVYSTRSEQELGALPSNDRLLKNKTETQTIYSTRSEQEVETLTVE